MLSLLLAADALAKLGAAIGASLAAIGAGLVKVLLKRFILTNSIIISIMPRKDIRLMPEASFGADDSDR